MSNHYKMMKGAAMGIALAMLVSCGGGGGGGGNGGPTPLTYSGNTSPAAITSTNAGTLTANVASAGSGIDSATSAVTGGSQAQAGQGQLDIGRRLARDVRTTVRRAGNASALTSIPIDETDACPNGGSVRVFGDVSPSGLGTVTVVFTNCRIGSETLSGQAIMRVDGFDLPTNNVTDSTLTFPRLSIRGSANTDIGGSLRVQTNLFANTETVTENIVALDLDTGRMTKSENLVLIDAFNNIFSPSSYTEMVSGRVYDSVLGFVDLMTTTPLSFPTLTQEFPSSGEIVMTGASNARLRVTALSSTLANLALDLGNDGTFEIQARVQWTALRGPVGSDIGDSDGDGLPNGWETAFNVSDPNADPDNDGLNNRAEYQGGTNPNVANATPPPPPDPVPLPGGSATGLVVTLANSTDIVYDPVTDRIYAAVRSSAGTFGTVVPINPATGALGNAIAVGVGPTKLALSDNGQYLYVAFDGESSVDRVNMATQAVDLTINLGNSQFNGPQFAEDIAVLPGNAGSFAVSLRNACCSPRHEGVAIYDGASPRGTKTPGHTGSNVIEFSASATTLYGHANESSEFGFRRMTVSAGGVSVNDVETSFDPPELFSGFGADIHFGDGFLFTTEGRMIDPIARTVARTFALPSMFGNLVVSEPSLNRAFYMTNDTIRAFDTGSGAQVGSAAVSGMTGTPSRLIRWGARGIAVRTTTGQIFMLQSTSWIP
jgi:hypothetical protein